MDQTLTDIQKLFAAQNPDLLDGLNALALQLKIYFEKLPELAVNPKPDSAAVEALLHFSFDHPLPVTELLERWTDTLSKTLLHVDHPMYFGVFNPNPLFVSVLGEMLTAQLNPNLASTASARIAIAIETKIMTYFGKKMGWQNDVSGTFCSGGTEANLTAVLAALARYCPMFFKEGSRFLTMNPVIYVSTETHHSIQKAIKMLGLGVHTVREIPVNESLQFDSEKLINQIESDKAAGMRGILIVGTVGSTSAGIIDPLEKLGNIAKKYDMHFHIDASWGAGILLLPEYREQLTGIESADSFTMDAHKWFAVPMTAGIFITRHQGILRAIFDVNDSVYMPLDTQTNHDTEPFRDSLEWSRRFSGLKLLFSLMAIGESGYQTLFRHSIQIGAYFRSKLTNNTAWQIENNTTLPVICFRPQTLHTKNDIETFAREFNAKGKAWISSTAIAGKPVLRVGFPNFATRTENVDYLLELLQQQLAK